MPFKLDGHKITKLLRTFQGMFEAKNKNRPLKRIYTSKFKDHVDCVGHILFLIKFAISLSLLSFLKRGFTRNAHIYK